ncbi:type IV secretion system protein [Campylobacter lari]|uniref:type IV secretion system protein n=1 Tax=Campylobacter lari TaxID=201 RepID=UPI0008748AAD|nr:type IV secretion system protein [Campylobacter lari]EAK0768206.1 type IV secretion system protein [Campylobacter lari]EDP6895641.1 hypothetical protein [Campylobacter lari]EJV5920787.1 type IV secretion system protein [Campylobacter lari]MCV3399064.1 type IV secretion system protein [Campylobacter lari]MCV3414622.1 type IV secretion system protein [Campylobacter lari]
MSLEKSTIDTSWIDSIQMVMQDSLKPLFANIFEGIQQTLYNGVAYTIIGMIVMLWCLNLLKNGYPTREELWNATKWVLTVCFVFGIFYSYEAYSSFLGWLMIPAQWLKSATANLFNGSGETFGTLITNAINSLNDVLVKMWNEGMLKNSTGLFSTELTAMIATAFGMLCFWIFYLTTFLVLIGVACIVLSSTFFAMIILSFAPVVIPLLITKRTTPYFYSWLKLFISYSLFIPLSFFILSICMIPIQKVQDIGNIAEVYNNQFVNFLVPTIISIICLFMLKKIPNWVSQILGVQGLDGAGTGGGVDILKTSGNMGASFAGGMLASKMTGSGYGEAFKHGIANAIPGGKSLRQMANSIRSDNANNNLANAMDNLTDSLTGATAKAG